MVTLISEAQLLFYRLSYLVPPICEGVGGKWEACNQHASIYFPTTLLQDGWEFSIFVKTWRKNYKSPKEFGYFKALPSYLRQIHIAMDIAEIISLGKQLEASFKDMN